MPLQNGKTKLVINENIGELLKTYKAKGKIGTSHPSSAKKAQKQAVAIAYSKAGRSKKFAKGGVAGLSGEEQITVGEEGPEQITPMAEPEMEGESENETLVIIPEEAVEKSMEIQGGEEYMNSTVPEGMTLFIGKVDGKDVVYKVDFDSERYDSEDAKAYLQTTKVSPTEVKKAPSMLRNQDVINEAAI